MVEEFKQERDWLPVAILLTLLACLFAAIQIGDLARMLPMLAIIAPWSAAMVILLLVASFFRMARAREPRPLASGIAVIRNNWRSLLVAGVILLVAGLNLVSFMWIKPILNTIVPFRADPLLANVDHVLFLGRDPWRLAQFANFPGAGYIYHPLWFGTVIVALLAATFAPASPERSAVLLSYFVLWTLFAPLVHALLPAAGPVFFGLLGHGDRFAALPYTAETREVASYLWSFYENGDYGTGNGISAMPSMHVTTSTWVLIATWVCARNYVPLACIAYLVIAVMSVALGWHYAVDGVVGAAGAIGIFLVLRNIFRKRLSAPLAAPTPLTA